MEDKNETAKTPPQLARMELEAVAQAAMREGLSAEQVAYEQWVDTQPIEEVVAWDDMGMEARRDWVEKYMGEKEVLVVEDVRESVELKERMLVSAVKRSPTPTLEPQRTSQRVWLPTSTEDNPVKNKPQCPPCARLKRTWTRCRGGPPCVECQHRGLSAQQCQSYDLLQRSRKPRQKKGEGSKASEIRARQQQRIGGGGVKEEENALVA